MVYKRRIHVKELEKGDPEFVEEVFANQITSRLSADRVELLERMNSMENGEVLVIDIEGQEKMEEEELDRYIKAIRALVGTFARRLDWPKLPGGGRRAYQTAVYKDGGKTYLWVRKLPPDTRHR